MAKKQANKAILKSVSRNEELILKPIPIPLENTAMSISIVDKLNSWFKKYIIWVFCILILSWSLVRVCYYNSIVKSPLYSLYLSEASDNKFFDDWAKNLNDDWLNVKPFHPYHSWHKEYADYYLQRHPEKLKEIQAGNVSKDSLFTPGKVLWNEWYHGSQYHQEP